MKNEPKDGDRRIMARWNKNDVDVETDGPFATIAEAQAYSERKSFIGDLGVAVVQEYRQYSDWWHAEWVDVERCIGEDRYCMDDWG